MAITREMKCDYGGYCNKKAILRTEAQKGWFEISTTDNQLSVRKLKASDEVQDTAKQACPRHGQEVAEEIVRELNIFTVVDAEFEEAPPPAIPQSPDPQLPEDPF